MDKRVVVIGDDEEREIYAKASVDWLTMHRHDICNVLRAMWSTGDILNRRLAEHHIAMLGRIDAELLSRSFVSKETP